MRGLLIMANYNQEVEIGPVLERVEATIGKDDVVVVDDGSRDRSGDIAEEAGFLVLRHRVNRGIGAAIRTGIHHARANGYDYVTVMSTNGKIQPEEIPVVREPLLRGECDYVQGSRFLDGGDSPDLTPFRRLAIPVFTMMTNVILKRRFSDATCGFRSYKLDWLDDPRIDLDEPWLDRYELEYYIHYWACQLDLRIKEVPVNIVYSHLHPGRKSKIAPVTGWWSMIRPFVYLATGLRH